jgi:uncharacterized OsmC-like protein
MSAPTTDRVALERLGGYRIQADLGSGATLVLDEPPPLGENAGPNATRLLAAAIGNCLSASLLFCLAKSRVDVRGLTAEVTWELVRNERGRMRIGSASVKLRPAVGGEDAAKLTRCATLFEDFCIVTQSVREGFPVEVEIEPVAG